MNKKEAVYCIGVLMMITLVSATVIYFANDSHFRMIEQINSNKAFMDFLQNNNITLVYNAEVHSPAVLIKLKNSTTFFERAKVTAIVYVHRAFMPIDFPNIELYTFDEDYNVGYYIVLPYGMGRV